MGCLTDPNMIGLFGLGQIQLCDPTVIARSVGAPARIRFTVQATPLEFYEGGTDTIAGVLTEVNAAGVPHVVDLLQPIQVTSTGQNVAPPPIPYVIVSGHNLSSAYAGKDLHVAIGPKNYFHFSIGDVFVPDLTAMLRTDFVVPSAPAATPAKFSLSVQSIGKSVSATTKPTATIQVTNEGGTSAIDAVTGTTTDSAGNVVGQWTTVDTPLIPPGATQPVTLSMTTAPGSTYAGQTLTATFNDQNGNTARATFQVAAASGSTGQPPSTTPTPSTTNWGLIAGVASVVVGVGALAVGLRGR